MSGFQRRHQYVYDQGGYSGSAWGPGRATTNRVFGNVFQGPGTVNFGGYGAYGYGGNNGGGLIGQLFNIGNTIGAGRYVLQQGAGAGYDLSNVGGAFGGLGHRTRGNVNRDRAYEHGTGIEADALEAQRYAQGRQGSPAPYGGAGATPPFVPAQEQHFSRRDQRRFGDYMDSREEEQRLLRENDVQDVNGDRVLDSRDVQNNEALRAQVQGMEAEQARLARRIGAGDMAAMQGAYRRDVTNQMLAAVPQNTEAFFEAVKAGNQATDPAQKAAYYEQAVQALQAIPAAAYNNIQLDRRHFNPADLQANPATGAQAMPQEFQQALTQPHTAQDLVKIASGAYAKMGVGTAIDPQLAPAPAPAAGAGQAAATTTAAGQQNGAADIAPTQALKVFSDAMIAANEATTREARVNALMRAGSALKLVQEGKAQLDMEQLDPALKAQLQEVIKADIAAFKDPRARLNDTAFMMESAATALAGDHPVNQAAGNLSDDINAVVKFQKDGTPIPGLNPDAGPDGTGHSAGNANPQVTQQESTQATAASAPAPAVQEKPDGTYIHGYRYEMKDVYKNRNGVGIEGALHIAELQVALEMNGFETDSLGKEKVVDGVRGTATNKAIAAAVAKLEERGLLPADFKKGDMSPDNLDKLTAVLGDEATIEKMKAPVSATPAAAATTQTTPAQTTPTQTTPAQTTPTQTAGNTRVLDAFALGVDKAITVNARLSSGETLAFGKDDFKGARLKGNTREVYEDTLNDVAKELSTKVENGVIAQDKLKGDKILEMAANLDGKEGLSPEEWAATLAAMDARENKGPAPALDQKISAESLSLAYGADGNAISENAAAIYKASYGQGVSDKVNANLLSALAVELPFVAKSDAMVTEEAQFAKMTVRQQSAFLEKNMRSNGVQGITEDGVLTREELVLAMNDKKSNGLFTPKGSSKPDFDKLLAENGITRDAQGTYKVSGAGEVNAPVTQNARSQETGTERA